MRDTLETRIANASSLFDILMILKETIMLDLHVASLAYVDEVLSTPTDDVLYGCLKVRPFPTYNKQEEYNIQAYYFDKNLEFKQNDKVLIIYCDLNFLNSLKVIDNQIHTTSDTSVHSLKHAIVIPLDYYNESDARNFVRFDIDTQGLTSTEQQNARTNIDAINLSNITSTVIVNALGYIPGTGTITEIKVNNTSIATSGSANITVPQIIDLRNS